MLCGKTFSANGLGILCEQPVPERDRHLWQRSIGNVLARKGLLVHARSHVSRIDEYRRDAFLMEFAGERTSEELECRFRRTIGPPPRIRRRGRVARDVHDQASPL